MLKKKSSILNPLKTERSKNESFYNLKTKPKEIIEKSDVFGAESSILNQTKNDEEIFNRWFSFKKNSKVQINEIEKKQNYQKFIENVNFQRKNHQKYLERLHLNPYEGFDRKKTLKYLQKLKRKLPKNLPTLSDEPEKIIQNSTKNMEFLNTLNSIFGNEALYQQQLKSDDIFLDNMLGMLKLHENTKKAIFEPKILQINKPLFVVNGKNEIPDKNIFEENIEYFQNGEEFFNKLNIA